MRKGQFYLITLAFLLLTYFYVSGYLNMKLKYRENFEKYLALDLGVQMLKVPEIYYNNFTENVSKFCKKYNIDCRINNRTIIIKSESSYYNLSIS